jgi:tetratricopeptide (TPR) repeat protein
VNEHRVYLSLAGFCGVAGFLLVRLATVFPVSIFDFSIGRRSGRALVASVALVFAVGLGIETRHRNTVWSSHLNLWQDAALNGGTWRAHMNYGLALEGAGRKDEALAQFEEAVRLGPYAFAHLNLGHARVKRGDVARGITHLRTAVRLWPSAPEPHLYLALGLDRQGKAAEAEREYQRAIAIRPRYLKAYRYLARFLERRGRLAEALAELQRLRAIDPSAAALEKQIDRLGQRLSALRTPNGGDLFREAFALQKNNYRGRAIERYEQLLALNPDHRQGAFNLAYAYL